MQERQKPSVRLWVAAGMVAALVLYPLSFGPVVWLASREMLPNWTVRIIMFFYYPINWVVRILPQPIVDAIDWYLRFWEK